MKFLFLLFVLPILSVAQTDTAKTVHPDLNKISYDNVKWTKAEGGSFWFYYKPAQYFFKNNEFETITLDNGDVLVYLYEVGIYLLLDDFAKIPVNTERGVGLASSRNAIFIKRSRGTGFWIYDKGKYVDHLERVGVNNETHLYVYRSGITDKRYFINENDFVFAPLSKAVGILSE
jgi:hypothetical protein